MPSAASLLPWAINQGGRGCWGTLVPPTSLRGLPPGAPYLLQGFHLSSLSLSNASLWAAFCSLIMMFFSMVTWLQKPIRHRSGSILAEPGPHGEEIGRCPARGGVCAARAPTPSQETQVPINPPGCRGQGTVPTPHGGSSGRSSWPVAERGSPSRRPHAQQPCSRLAVSTCPWGDPAPHPGHRPATAAIPRHGGSQGRSWGRGRAW